MSVIFGQAKAIALSETNRLHGKCIELTTSGAKFEFETPRSGNGIASFEVSFLDSQIPSGVECNSAVVLHKGTIKKGKS